MANAAGKAADPRHAAERHLAGVAAERAGFAVGEVEAHGSVFALGRRRPQGIGWGSLCGTDQQRRPLLGAPGVAMTVGFIAAPTT